MEPLDSFVVLLSYLAAFLATWLALTSWQRKSSNWARPFAVMMLALAQWSLALALELSAPDPEASRLWRMPQIVGSSTMPVAWFVFAARYGGREGVVSANRRRLLYAVPVATIMLALTNAQHGLVWESWLQTGSSRPVIASFGRWHGVQVLYSLSLLLAGIAVIWQTAWQTLREQRWHILSIIVGATMPVLGYMLQSLGRNFVGTVDLLPLLLVGGVASLAWTVSHQQILDLVPIARQTVLSSMPDGVLVVNNQDRLVEINPAAESIIGWRAGDVLGRRIVEVMPQWSDVWYEAVIRGELQTEIGLPVAGNEHTYELRLTPIYTRSGHFSGRLIVLRDMTEHKRTQGELLARRQLFENLVAVARATAEGSGLQTTLQNALDVAASLTGAEYGSLFLLDSAGRVTHSILARGKTAPGSRREIVGTVMDKGLAGWAVRHRKTALLHDTADDERWVNFPDQPYTARSVLVVPITSGSDVPGVLTLQHSRPDVFKEEDEALLRAASHQMALALHKGQLFDEQLQLALRQQTLYEALKTLGRHLEPSTVVHLAAETIARLTGWSAVGIFVPGKDDGYLELQAGSGLLADCEGKRFSSRRWAHGRAFSSEQTRTRLGFEPSGDQGDELSWLRSAIFVPLRHAQSRLGLLAVGVEEPGALSEEDTLLAESLAETVALAMTNAQLFQAIADEHSRLEALIESSRDGIILVGYRQHILFLNHTSIELLGVSGEPEDWMYRSLSEIFESLHEEAPQPLVMTEDTGLERLEGARVAQGEIELNNRELRWQNLPVRKEKMTLGRLIVLQDISRERSLQRMREDLTHTMVHDLRNPLNIVSGSLEMARDKLPAEASDAKQLMGIARHSTDRMLHLVNGILSISRLESGKMPLNRSAVDLATLIDQVLVQHSPLAEDKSLRLSRTNRFEAESLPAVYADAELVERILQNLVSNAIKFTPAGGSIAVCTTWDDAAEIVQVGVQDSGPGIPADIREQLFEKFVTGLHEERGSGLGLAFCRMAVEAHGGQIWVESEPGNGASFFFTLPEAVAADEA